MTTTQATTAAPEWEEMERRRRAGEGPRIVLGNGTEVAPSQVYGQSSSSSSASSATAVAPPAEPAAAAPVIVNAPVRPAEPVPPDDAPELTTAEMILGITDIRIERVYVPAWKAWVYVKTLDGRGRDAFEVSSMKDGKRTLENIRAKLLAQTICNKAGVPLFNESHVEELGKKNGAAIALLWDKASALNAITDDDVEELAKNSGRAGSSTT